MKLTKKLEAEVLKAYITIWDAYLKGDMKTFASILDEKCHIIGSAAGEVFNNKKSAVKYYKTTAKQISGKAEFRNRKISVLPVDNGVIVNEQSDFYLLIDDQWTFYGPARVSSLFHNKSNKWKIIHQHGSFPDSKTEEGEQVNADKIKAENVQLRDAVKRRTEELENKNRDLEIETSLEKVRAVAMGMRKPDDMLDMCHVISEELTNLGVKQIRNIQTAIIDEAKASYLNYDYFRLKKKTFITDVEYKKQKDVNAFVKKMLKDPEGFFTKTFKDKELKEWINYQKRAAQYVDPHLYKVRSLHYYFYSIGAGALGVSTYAPLNKEEIGLLKRFRNVFQLAYRRFTDIQTAEAQVREAQIEAALERVRTRTMAMHQSKELHDVIREVYDQLRLLQFRFDGVDFMTDYSEKGFKLWLAAQEHSFPESIYVPAIDNKIFRLLKDVHKKGKDFFTFQLVHKEKDEYFKHLFRNTIIKNVPEELKQQTLKAKGMATSCVVLKNIILSATRLDSIPYTDEENAILKRFAFVFEQSYTRFLDLQKAEAQAREAKIEAALERTRTQSMLMQHSDEIMNVSNVFHEQLLLLGIPTEFSYVWLPDETKHEHQFWATWAEEEKRGAIVYKNKAITYPLDKSEPYTAACFAAWQNKEQVFIEYIAPAEVKNYFSTFEELLRDAKKMRTEFFTEGLYYAEAYMKYGCFGFNVRRMLSEDEQEILRRFTVEFERTYTRFLDLQKAEAQTREAKIETALEKVRSRSMAMHKSEEIQGIVEEVFIRLKELEVGLDTANILIFKKGSDTIESWTASSKITDNRTKFIVPVSAIKHLSFVLDAMDKGEELVVHCYNFKEKNKWFTYLFTHTDYKYIPEERKKFILNSPLVTVSVGISGNIGIQLNSYSRNSFAEEENNILVRFAKVFEQSYTRFLDLQKAEAQTREAQIEAALERVRSRTMGMQHSAELGEVAAELFTQMNNLVPNLWTCGFVLCEKDRDEDEWWLSMDTGFTRGFFLPNVGDYTHNTLYKGWMNGDAFRAVQLEGKDLQQHYDWLMDLPIARTIFQEMANAGLQRPDWQKLHAAYFSKGYLVLITTEPCSEEEIFKRFAQVFDQTYTRFLDLQKAEAQTREAQIEAALERVRSRTMAMHKTDELFEAAELIGKELSALGVTSMNVSYAFVDDEEKNASYYSVNPVDGKIISFPFIFPHTETKVMRSILSSWKKQEPFNMIDLDEKATLKHQTWIGEHIQNQVIKNNSGIPFSIEAFLAVSPKKAVIYTFNFKQGYLFNIGGERLTNAQEELVLRFTKVFEMTYRRFLDLKQAEEQTREAQIELGLERVRARAMAMQNSDELKELIGTVFTELTKLDLVLTRCVIMIFDGQENNSRWWMANSEDPNNPAGFFIKRHEHPPNVAYFKAWRERKIKYTYALQGKVKQDWDKFLFNETELKNLPDFVIEGMKAPDLVYLNASFNNFGNLTLASLEPLSDEHFDILLRFAKVFDLTYTRFNDLQKAEAQAREAQIELGLERVRARAMAMQKSDELSELVDTVFKELTKLDFAINMCIINIIDESTLSNMVWGANPDTGKPPESYYMKFEDYPFHHAMMKGYQERASKFIYVIEGEEKKIYDEYLFNETEFSKMPLEAQAASKALKKYVASFTFSNFGGLQTVASEDMSDEKLDILARFGKVFDLTYTRFNDLKQAEAQARESQIQLALERVRARTMAMQKSDEMAEAASLLFTQIADLGTNSWSSGFIIFQPDELSINSWMSKPDGSMGVPFNIPVTEDPFFIKIYEAYKKGEEFFVMESRGKELEETYKYMFSLPGAAKSLGAIEDLGFQMPTFQITHCVFFPTGFLMFITYEPCQEMWEIFKRFGKVFEQTYTRFLDLQKAEEQAREAKIEAALEKVRSRSLAMHTTNELGEVVKVIVEKLQDLGVVLDANGVILCTYFHDSKNVLHWIVSPDFSMAGSYLLPYFDHPIFNAAWHSKENGDKYFSKAFSVEAKNSFFEYAFEHSDYKHFPEEFKQWVFQNDKHSLSFAWQKNSAILIPSHTGVLPTESDKAILIRFSKVFEQAYVRFLDLQKAEAQARESQIQLALERVRARTMAMQKSEELPETSHILFEQMKELGEPVEQLTIGVVQEENKVIEISATLHGDILKKIYQHSLDEPFMMSKIYHAWKTHQKTLIVELKGDELNAYNKYRNELTKSEMFPTNLGDEHRRIVYAAFFSKGMLALGANEPRPPESLQLLERFAGVFDQAYIRFIDLKKAEAQSRESQIQLALERVRARTMAMQHSDELQDTAILLFQQMKALGIETGSCGFNIWNEKEKASTVWMSSPEGGLQTPFRLPHTESAIYKQVYAALKNGEDFLIKEVGGKELEKHFDYLLTLPGIGDVIKKLRETGYRFPETMVYNFAFFNNGYLSFHLHEQHPEVHDIFKRFAKVFEQTYTRFLDLQKAEAQTREARIEAALEKVRSRSLAMHKSEELQEVVTTVLERLNDLDIQTDAINLDVFHENKKDAYLWTAVPGHQYSKEIHIPYNETTIYKDIYEGIISGKELHSKVYSRELKDEFLNFVFKHTDFRHMPEERKEMLFATDGSTVSVAYAKNTAIIAQRYRKDAFSDDDNEILKRFARVFEQAYTRFLDLQKSEAQARESQIQLALERVRARTMAMQKSNELTDVAGLLFEQVSALGIKTWTAGFNVWSEDNNSYVDYITSPQGGFIEPYTVYTETAEALTDISNARKSGVEFDVQYVEGEKIKKLYLALTKLDEKQYEIMLQDGVSFPSHQYEHFVFGSKVSLMFITYEPVTEAHDIFKRLGKVFEQTYTRFLDLQKSEAQARESQIQLALERVRARTMAMQKSDELMETAVVLFDQLKQLGEHIERTIIGVVNEEEGIVDFWATRPDGSQMEKMQKFPIDEPIVMQKVLGAWRQQKKSIVIDLQGEELEYYFQFMKTRAPRLKRENFGERRVESFAFFSKGILGVISVDPNTPANVGLYERFAAVFDQTYTRFLDLQNAEAQARESQIEASLERVRSRSMGMQKSEELKEVIQVVYEQFVHLNIHVEHTGFIMDYKERNDMHIWLADKHVVPFQVTIPYFDCAHWNSFNEAKEKGLDFFTNKLSFEEKNKFYQDLFKLIPGVPEETLQYYFSCPGLAISTVLLENVGLYIENFSGIPYTDEENKTLMRFGKVFQQTYTRFLDLQKAEEQVREAQIEASLERVRSKTMAMHKSEEVTGIAVSLNEELLKLGFEGGSTIMIINKETGDTEQWTGFSEDKTLKSCYVPYFKHPYHDALLGAWKNEEKSLVYIVAGKEKESVDEHYFATGYKHFPESDKKWMREMESVTFSHAFMKYGAIHWGPGLLTEEQLRILQRFSKVFEQSYTRFLDLQKAEAQAREAKIETALERVRARTMAMQKSDELSETAVILYEQLYQLGNIPEQINIGIVNENENRIEWWITEQGGKQIDKKFTTSTSGPATLTKIFKCWKEQQRSVIIDSTGKELEDWIAYQNEMGIGLNEDLIKGRRVNTVASFANGIIAFTTPEPPSNETISLLERFATVFNQTYTRFLDLQKAEAQAKEAKIEAALERVRSRSMAMHSPQELKEVALELRNQLGLLEQPELEVCAIHLYEESPDYFEAWGAVRPPGNEGKIIQVQVQFPKKGIKIVDEMFMQYESGAQDYVLINEGEKVPEWLAVLKERVPEGYKMVIQSLKGRRPEDTRAYWSMADFKGGSLIMTTYIPPSDDARKLLRRFANVFGLAYRRFIDLKNAETQKQEAQIELALERVRARTMAMHKSEELAETAQVLFQQLSELGGIPDRISIGIADETNGVVNFWTTDQQGSHLDHSFSARLNERTTIAKTYQGWKDHKKSLVIDLHGEELKEWIQFAREEMGIAVKDDQIKERRVHTLAFFSHGWILVTSHEPQLPNTIQVLERFASVFNLTYRRFLDLQKAEAQAREAQIETALEKVRSRSLAMHKSDELQEVVNTVFERLTELNIEMDSCNIAIFKEGSRDYDYWIASHFQKRAASFHLPYTDLLITKDLIASRESGKEYFAKAYSFEEKNEWFEIAFENTDFKLLSEERKQFILNAPAITVAIAFSKHTGVQINRYSNKLPTEGETEILKRFSKVFEQAYIRFLDLQKAESNAREAQIEAGLERVRARTMAMHSSEDVSIATATMFTELERLGIENFRGGITNIIPNRTQHVWSVNNLEEGKVLKSVGTFNIDAHPFWQLMYKEWEAKKDFIHYYLAGEDKQDYFEVLNAIHGYLPQNFQQYPDLHFQVYYFNEGAVWTNSLQPHSEEDKLVMKKFASVFSLTFRRYQDLKKAEAQAREATIEAALERVRGKAMAMHSSKDLASTIGVFYHELEGLNLTPRRCGVGLIDKEKQTAEISTMNASADGQGIELIGNLNLRDHPVLTGVYNNWLTKTEYHPVLRGNEIKDYYQVVRPQIDFPDYPNDTIQYGYFFFFEEGGVYAWTEKELNEDELKIYRRFTSVLSLTYKRYKDLKDAEARTQAAIKDAALDRIRADIASMRTINDLDRITPLIWNELTVLGIPFIRCGVFIMDEDEQLIHTFLSTPDGKAIAAFHLPYDTPGNLSHVISNWKIKNKYIDHWDEKEFIQFAEILMQQGALTSAEQYLKTIPKNGFHLHFLPFLQGMLYVGNTTQLNNDEIELIQHVADAFSTAYARYEDFNKLEAAKQQVENTLTDLKQAQTQLVQSEKMASLGELTAGIAHEIQNPLNFVNNFSDVSSELLDEMVEELAKGNLQSAKEIVEDVKQNLEKINHHGKRADGIVKGMLQHSRTSSGQKEPTDINILADEYLRLAYHGLRAKDKFFNAKFETEFDNSIEKINIIPQDIGRVILNLINNAFYTVSEKKKHASEGSALNGYEPTVTVTTKKENGKIEIKVRDNGNGIPKKVLDKIFQPFFTTKPTGQGTGLGLSLAYDIVTKGHGGELKVETKEGEGSEFIIQLTAT